MKKFLFLFLMLPLLFIGCKSDDDSNDNSAKESVVWSQSKDGYTEKITYKVTTEDDSKDTSVAYAIQEDSTSKGLAFAVIKTEIGKNIIYKGYIAALRKDEPFEHGYWDEYIISTGQKTVSMKDALSSPNDSDDGYYFIMVGALFDAQIEALKNANELEVTLGNSSDSSRKTSFAVDYEFIKALLKYM